MNEKVITIFGSGKAKSGDVAYELADKLGEILARAGFIIANGGYGGTMLAAARSAAQAGGKVLGVTCSAFGGGAANEYITEQIVTASLDERLNKLVAIGDAYIVLPGGTGTLLELALVWELKNKGFMESGKAIILVGEYWRSLIELVAAEDSDGVGCIQQVERAVDVKDILDGLL